MRLPERALLPAVGKSHATQLVGVEPVQQLEQARTPARLGGDAFQQVAQDGQDAELLSERTLLIMVRPT